MCRSVGLATFGVFLSRMGLFPFQGHWATWKCPEICSTYVYQAMGLELSTLYGHTWCPLVNQLQTPFESLYTVNRGPRFWSPQLHLSASLWHSKWCIQVYFELITSRIIHLWKESHYISTENPGLIYPRLWLLKLQFCDLHTNNPCWISYYCSWALTSTNVLDIHARV